MKQFLLIMTMVCAFGLYFYFDIGNQVSLSALRAELEQNVLSVSLVFFLAITIVAAFNLPGIGILAIAGGALFGLYIGAVLVLVGAAIGATASMMMARTLFRHWAQSRFKKIINRVNRGIESEGALYIFILRMNPVIPFCVLNPVVGLTSMSARRFYFATQFGLIPLSGLYVYIGSNIGQIDKIEVASLITPSLMLAFVTLAVFPPLVKFGVDYFRASKVS